MKAAPPPVSIPPATPRHSPDRRSTCWTRGLAIGLGCVAILGLGSVGCGGNEEMQTRGKTPGEVLTIKIGNEMVAFSWVPRGSFVMGSPEGETEREDDEKQVEVKIPDGFWLAKTECTQATWQDVMGNNPAEFDKNRNNPVETVSWEDCQHFMAAIQKYAPSAHWRFDLPTEAQWEYACRAGSPYPFTDKLENVSWYLNNSRGRTHPVGTKSPNPLGLHDMHGNVAEWCSSLYSSKLPGSSDEGTKAPPPEDPAEANFRVIRGGSWDSAWACRAGARNSDSPSLRINRVGFRIAIVPVK